MAGETDEPGGGDSGAEGNPAKRQVKKLIQSRGDTFDLLPFPTEGTLIPLFLLSRLLPWGLTPRELTLLTCTSFEGRSVLAFISKCRRRASYVSRIPFRDKFSLFPKK